MSKYFPKFGDMRVAVLDDKQDNKQDKIVDTVPTKRPIVLHDLMRHTSGLVYGGRGTTPVHKQYLEGSGVAGASMTSGEFLDRLSSASLYHQPGAAWDYGFGLDVLGLVIEQITGVSLGEYFTKTFSPRSA